MSDKHLIPAASSLRSARLFNLLAVASTPLAAGPLGQFIADKKMAFLPMAIFLPPVMIWLAATIFANDITHLPTGWMGVRALMILPLMILPLVPWALYDVWWGGKEDWQDLEIDDVKKVGTHV